jgi:YMGG-like Gly-zipper
MKQILFTLTTAVIFLTACNSEKKSNTDTEKRIVFTDTAALRLSNAATDKAASEELLAPEANQDNTKPKVVTVIKYVNAPQKQRAPRRRASSSQQQQQAPTQQSNESVNDAPSTSGTTGTAGTSGGGTNSGDVATAPAPEVKKKKGWSDAAKGATIGGVGGAVAGAVISKNKGKGAVIGGVIGAAGGYILGRKADKKSGRANYTQK